MRFEDWFHQIEAYSTRSERFWEDMKRPDADQIEDWLRAAYHAGMQHGAELASGADTVMKQYDDWRATSTKTENGYNG